MLRNGVMVRLLWGLLLRSLFRASNLFRAGIPQKTKIRCGTGLLAAAFTGAAKMETEGCQRSGRVGRLDSFATLW
jgi:hypothetical protein